MNLESQRRWQLERWASWVRVAALPWVILEVGLLSPDFPSTRYEVAAWVMTAVLALGTGIFFWVDRQDLRPGVQRYVCFASFAFNTAVIWAFVAIYTYVPGTPARQLLFSPAVEAALRFGLLGGLVMPL